MLSGNPPGAGGHRPAPLTTTALATPDPAALPGPSTPESAPQAQALVELMAALDDMAQVSGYALEPEEIATLAEDLVGGLQGEVLDLRQFDRAPDDRPVRDAEAQPSTPAGVLTPRVWRGLDAAALALGGSSIRKVVLPAGMPPGELGRVARTGLSQLPQLREVTVRVPADATRVDLRPLAVLAKAGQPLAVQLDAPGDALQEVLSAPSLRERALQDPEGGIHASKCVVLYPPQDSGSDSDSESDGKAETKSHKPRPLSSHFYRRRATGMEAAASAAGLDMERFASTLNLNGEARFTPAVRETKSAPAGPAPDTRIVCRHLCMVWLAMRAQARARKGTLEAQRFSYAPLATVESIAKQATAATEQEFMEMLCAPPTAVMLARDFGQVLARQLEAMETGDTRLFTLVTSSHALTVDVQRLRRDHGGELRDEFIVDVYDPNRTVEHVRASLGSLEEVRAASLSRWLLPGMMAEYFLDGEPAIASLYAYGTVRGSQVARHEASAAATGDFRLPAQLSAHSEYLYWSLMAGDADRVRASVAAIVALPGVKGIPLFRRLSAHGGLSWAMETGRTAAVRAYVEAVLAAPSSRLSSADRFDLLLGLADNVPAVHGAMAYGHVDTALAWLKAVLASPLHASHRAVLALACDARDRPLARVLCEQPPVPAGAALPRQHRFLHAYVSEVLAAPGFGADEREAMLAAEDPGQEKARETAAQLALATGNPRAAGAMVCAALEAGLPAARREQALAALGVGIDEVLDAMARGGASGEPWAARIAAARKAPPPDVKAAKAGVEGSGSAG